MQREENARKEGETIKSEKGELRDATEDGNTPSQCVFVFYRGAKLSFEMKRMLRIDERSASRCPNARENSLKPRAESVDTARWSGARPRQERDRERVRGTPRRLTREEEQSQAAEA